MTTTIIEQTDPATGVQYDVRPDLRGRVESAARLLEGKIGDIEPVAVTARCNTGNTPMSASGSDFIWASGTGT